MRQELIDTLNDMTTGIQKTAACGDGGMHYCKSCEKEHEGTTCDCGESCDCAMKKEASEEAPSILKVASEVDPSIALLLHKKAAGPIAAVAKNVPKAKPDMTKAAPAPAQPGNRAIQPPQDQKGTMWGLGQMLKERFAGKKKQGAGVPQTKGGAGNIKQMYKELENQ